MRLVFLGLSLSSSWGNGHATTYRALLKGLAERGHDLLFLEREQPWYAEHRDMLWPKYCRLAFYHSPEELRRFEVELKSAAAVIIGSYVPDGVAVVRELREKILVRGSQTHNVTPLSTFQAGAAVADCDSPLLCFYDIDTPITLRRLAAGEADYLTAAMVPEFDLYLSFTGGPTLRALEDTYGARMARALYCAVDAAVYHPMETPKQWALGYLGTYSPDRQPALRRLLLEPAHRLPHLRFVVAGSQYPSDIGWPKNVDRIEHLAPDRHPEFYCSLSWALNLTRADMLRAGYSPSVRLFEATACGAPVISDPWPGLHTLFAPGEKILTASDGDAVLRALAMPESLRQQIAHAGRQETLRRHTASQRARELETYLRDAAARAMPAEQGAVL